MGQTKKIVRFNNDLDGEVGTSREQEDDASRKRLAQYERLSDKQIRNDAIEGENLWRESIGLEPVDR